MDMPENNPAETPNARQITTDDEEKHRRRFMQSAFGLNSEADSSTQKTKHRNGKILTLADYNEIVYDIGIRQKVMWIRIQEDTSP